MKVIISTVAETTVACVFTDKVYVLSLEYINFMPRYTYTMYINIVEIYIYICIFLLYFIYLTATVTSYFTHFTNKKYDELTKHDALL